MPSTQWKAGNTGSDTSGGTSYNERSRLRGKREDQLSKRQNILPTAVPFVYGPPPEGAANDWGRSSHINKATRTLLLSLPNADRTSSSLVWKH